MAEQVVSLIKKRWRVWGSFLALLLVIAAYVTINQPASSSNPADKVVASGDNLTPVTADSVLLTAHAKTANPTDLIFLVTLECSINTELVTEDSGVLSEASANVDVWVEVDDKVVPIKSTSEPPQNAPEWGTEEADSATFCNRVYGRTVTDQDNDGKIDKEDDYIRTKSTHSFNWLRFNLGSGPHKIEVVANFTTSTQGNAFVFAQVGNRTLVVIPTKMANDASF